MAKDWEYARATKWIAEHGGTQKALEVVKNYYMKKGFEKGVASRNPLVAAVGVVCFIAGFGGKYAYDKVAEKRSQREKAKAVEDACVKKAETELADSMKYDITFGEDDVKRKEPNEKTEHASVINNFVL